MTATGTQITNPSLNVTCRVTFNDPINDCKATVVGGLVNVTVYDPHIAVLSPGASAVVTAATSPSSFVTVQTPQRIRMRVNGGAEDFIVDRFFLMMGTVTQVELFNTETEQLKEVKVNVNFANGTVGS